MGGSLEDAEGDCPVRATVNAFVFRLVFGLVLIQIAWVSHAMRSSAAEPSTRAANPSRLLRTLTGRSEPVRLKMIRSLQQNPQEAVASLNDLLTAGEFLLKEDRNLEKRPNDVARESLLELMKVLGETRTPQGNAMLIELLGSSDSKLAMIAADILGENQSQAALEALASQVDRPEFQESYGFRFNLVRAMVRIGGDEAEKVLGEIRGQLAGQLRHEIDKVLPQADAPVAKPRLVEQVAYESLSRERHLGNSHQYYGIDLVAQRMLFVIDCSGSMSEISDSLPRIEHVKRELIAAIESLHDDDEFGIISYDKTVRVWRSTLSVADPMNKRAAVHYVQYLRPGSTTNTHGALAEAFTFDDQLEAVFLLTDGRPTCGKSTATTQIVAEVSAENRWRHLKFNTIGVGVGGVTEAFLKDLAQATGGEFRKVRER